MGNSFLAGLFEIVWAYTMKLSDGFSRLNYMLVNVRHFYISY